LQAISRRGAEGAEKSNVNHEGTKSTKETI
jgi:hypothetical protein